MNNFAISAVCIGLTFAYVVGQFGQLLTAANPF